MPEPVVWLDSEVQRVFGRRLAPPRPSKLTRLVQALGAISRDVATQKVSEVASDGYSPDSLSYFAPIFERAAAEPQTVTLGAGELIDFAARLEARGA